MNSQTFPLLIPEDTEGSSYLGFITIKGLEIPFGIHIDQRNASNLKNASLRGSPELCRLVAGQEHRLEQCSTLEEFLIDLKDLLEQIVTKDENELMCSSTYYSTLLEELDAIGWDKLQSIDHALKNISLRINDSSGRQHTIKVVLPSSYPSDPPVVHVDLPTSISISLHSKSGLRKMISLFQEEVKQFQDLWLLLEDFDNHTWVLEPDKPKRSDLMRRIALGNHCSLQIDVDVKNPRGICECRLFGSEKTIGPLQDRLNKNLMTWDQSLTIRQNLEAILEMKFPSPLTTSKSEFNVECGICYSYRLNDEIPSQTCSNDKCGQPFHRACLYEWLRAIPTTRQSFNMLFGNCPYCDDNITTMIVEK